MTGCPVCGPPERTTIKSVVATPDPLAEVLRHATAAERDQADGIVATLYARAGQEDVRGLDWRIVSATAVHTNHQQDKP